MPIFSVLSQLFRTGDVKGFLIDSSAPQTSERVVINGSKKVVEEEEEQEESEEKEESEEEEELDVVKKPSSSAQRTSADVRADNKRLEVRVRELQRRLMNMTYAPKRKAALHAQQKDWDHDTMLIAQQDRALNELKQENKRVSRVNILTLNDAIDCLAATAQPMLNESTGRMEMPSREDLMPFANMLMGNASQAQPDAEADADGGDDDAEVPEAEPVPQMEPLFMAPFN